MTSSTIIILDFDDTLVHKDKTNEDFGFLKKLESLGSVLCIASRNHYYVVWNGLTSLGIEKHFRFIKADFRPKDYQIRHILSEIETSGSQEYRVIFVDDYLPNIERVREQLPDVECYQFGVGISKLSDLVEKAKAPAK